MGHRSDKYNDPPSRIADLEARVDKLEKKKRGAVDYCLAAALPVQTIPNNVTTELLFDQIQTTNEDNFYLDTGRVKVKETGFYFCMATTDDQIAPFNFTRQILLVQHSDPYGASSMDNAGTFDWVAGKSINTAQQRLVAFGAANVDSDNLLPVGLKVNYFQNSGAARNMANIRLLIFAYEATDEVIPNTGTVLL